jgi:hypothetical protein
VTATFEGLEVVLFTLLQLGAFQQFAHLLLSSDAPENSSSNFSVQVPPVPVGCGPDGGVDGLGDDDGECEGLGCDDGLLGCALDDEEGFGGEDDVDLDGDGLADDGADDDDADELGDGEALLDALPGNRDI